MEKSKQKLIIALGAVAVVVIVAVSIVFKVVIPEKNYDDAQILMDEKSYSQAIDAFTALGDYKDCAEKIKECRYLIACDLFSDKKYYQAVTAFSELEGYKDSAAKVKQSNYLYASVQLDNGNYEKALSLFNSLADYEDSAEKVSECKYLWASAYENEQKYIEALKKYNEIKDYKDSSAKIFQLEKNVIASSKVGDIVCFGTYEQDGNEENGAEIIEWQVLARDGNKVLVVSKNILASQQYNRTNVSMTWEKCGLRRWLDWYFEEDAFTDVEKDMILKVTLENEDNLVYDAIDGGVDTEDRIFILGPEEVELYFPEKADRAASGADESTWWIRTPSGINGAGMFRDWVNGYNVETVYYPCYIDADGAICAGGGKSITEQNGVRPAMWVEIS